MWIQNSQTRGMGMFIFISKNNWFHFCLWLLPVVRETLAMLTFHSSLESVANTLTRVSSSPFAGSVPLSKRLKLSETYLPCFSVRGWDWLGAWSKVRVLEFPFFIKVFGFSDKRDHILSEQEDSLYSQPRPRILSHLVHVWTSVSSKLDLYIKHLQLFLNLEHELFQRDKSWVLASEDNGNNEYLLNMPCMPDILVICTSLFILHSSPESSPFLSSISQVRTLRQLVPSYTAMKHSNIRAHTLDHSSFYLPVGTTGLQPHCSAGENKSERDALWFLEIMDTTEN